MILVCKAVLLLVFELIIEYILGTMLTKWVLKKEEHPFLSLLIGFMAYQAMFQIVSLVITFTTGVLHHASIVWCVLVLLTTGCGVVLEWKTILSQIRTTMIKISANKGMVMVGAVIVLLFCYYVSINGESNEDARYYIGLMTTSVDTDSLFRYNVYNGYQGDSLYLRRALSTFEIHGAVLCQITKLHPLVFARITRACQNVILTSAAVYLCSKELLERDKEQKENTAIITVVLFWMLQLIFADTIYTPATFLLYRAYEAKAFAANMLVLFGLYLCIKCAFEKKIRSYLLLIIFLWGCMALSTSAFIVTVAECMILLVAIKTKEIILKYKKERLHAR